MNLLVRNIARTISEEELLALFTPFGKVSSCDLVLDKATGGSKGFGFVEMPKEAEAKTAMNTLNGKEVSGVKLRVKKAKPHYENSPDNN